MMRSRGGVGASSGSAALSSGPAGLLLVDDEAAVLSALSRTLGAEGYPIFLALSAKEALEILEREQIGVVVSDYAMQEIDGAALLAEVRERFPQVQRIMLTGHADRAALEEPRTFRFLTKPWDAPTLTLTIAASFDQFAMLTENARLWQLAEQQNRELRELNQQLESRVARRTAQLERAKLEWERTFDAIVDPVAIVGEHYQVQRANLAYARAAGTDIRSVIGGRCHALLARRDTPCPGCTLAEVISGEPARGADVVMAGRTLNLWTYPIGAEGVAEAAPGATCDLPSPGPRAAVCHYRDVTDERALAAELARTQKLASLGVFAGGVAHEINNPLGGILAFTQLLQRSAPSAAEVQHTLKDIELSALRCKRIIESLLSFVHGSEHLARARVDLGTILHETTAAFRKDYALGDGVELSCHAAPGLPALEADPAQLSQLLRILLQNAEEAMGGRQGTVTIEARVGDNASVIIEITDQGAGIPESQLSRVFDPFYTTKAGGPATGLGLSICHRIVEQHGGTIEIESEVGHGTRVRVTLPLVGV